MSTLEPEERPVPACKKCRDLEWYADHSTRPPIVRKCPECNCPTRADDTIKIGDPVPDKSLEDKEK